MDARRLLHDVADRAADWLESLPDRRVTPRHDPSEMEVTSALGRGPVPEAQVIADLAREAEPGLAAMNSPRFFGYVIGGAYPVGIAADWLASAWDQNTGLSGPTPALAALEDVAGRWLLDVLALPAEASFGFVTGCQMAHVTCLAAARHRVLADAGWDAEADGLYGAPPIRVVAGEERHVTVDRALRLLGMGALRVVGVATDERGAMRPDALAAALDGADDAPTIVIAQAGNVNTGAIDPMEEIATAARAAGAWLHVDGAFGLWAAASSARRELVRGIERADSWATDAHKWLNVPYDCGVAIVRDAEAHRAAISVTAAYIPHDPESAREPMDYNPEFSRRARALPVYATLRALGRDGVAELVDRLCECASRFAERLPAAGYEVLGHELNQVLVSLPDDPSVAVALGKIYADGTCWPTGSMWRGRACIRISVCNWQTTADDVDRAIEVMAAAAR